jgi:hypothetical protein
MKPTKIIKIKFTKKEQEEIDRINNGIAVPIIKTVTTADGRTYEKTINKRFSYEMARKRLVQLYTGLCRCGDWPAYKIMKDVGDEHQGAWLVERYCQKCYDKQGVKK